LKPSASAVSKKTTVADLAVSLRPRIGFGCFNEPAEVDSAVSMRPWNPFQQRGSLLRNDNWLSIPLKGYYIKSKYCTYVNIIYLIDTRKRKY
jgi:hypothetical protein